MTNMLRLFLESKAEPAMTIEIRHPKPSELTLSQKISMKKYIHVDVYGKGNSRSLICERIMLQKNWWKTLKKEFHITKEVGKHWIEIQET